MAYPSKTDRQTILAAAVDQLARDGLRGISLRSLAGSLGIAPNAIYRYFADRSHLEAAASAAIATNLHAALRLAIGKRNPEHSIRSIASAYVKFAREQRSLYEVFMTRCPLSGEDAAAHEQLWLFVVGQVARVSGEARAREAAVALWAFLHGMAALEAAEVFGEVKPLSSFDFGLDAWVAAASSHSS